MIGKQHFFDHLANHPQEALTLFGKSVGFTRGNIHHSNREAIFSTDRNSDSRTNWPFLRSIRNHRIIRRNLSTVKALPTLKCLNAESRILVSWRDYRRFQHMGGSIALRPYHETALLERQGVILWKQNTTEIPASAPARCFTHQFNYPGCQTLQQNIGWYNIAGKVGSMIHPVTRTIVETGFPSIHVLID